MATYVPNATDVTQPTEDKFVETAAAEFRALKLEVAAVKSGVGTGGVVSHAAVESALESAATYLDYTVTTPWAASDESNNVVIKRAANYTGGGVDAWGNRQVGHAFAAVTTTNATAANCEMSLYGAVHSYANILPGALPLGQAWPQNVGGVHHAFQFGTAPIWGSWISAQNKRNVPQALNNGAVIGLEINVGITGMDNYASSVGIQCVPQAMASGACEAWSAFWASGSPTETWQYAFKADYATGASFYSKATGQFGVRLTGTYGVAVDTSTSIVTTGTAVRIKENSYIALDQYDQFRMKYNTSSGALEFYNGATRHGYINLASGADTDLAAGGGTYTPPAPVWTPLTLINGWTALDPGIYGTPAVYVDPFRVLHFRGIITGGASGSVCCNLPAGYRPAYAGFIPTYGAGVLVYFQINADGNCVINGTAANITLAGVTYVAA